VTRPAPAPDAGRDRRVVRRGLLAGGVVWAVLGVALAVSQTAAGGGGRGVLAGILLGLVLGLIVASGWLLLALLVDIIAGQVPTRRRVATSVAVLGAAMLSPLLLLAAGG
jgi:hypothetical protein